MGIKKEEHYSSHHCEQLDPTPPGSPEIKFISVRLQPSQQFK